MTCNFLKSFALFAALATSVSVSANDGIAVVETTIAALEAEDTDKASRLITAIEETAFSEQEFWTPREAIAALANCKARSLGALQNLGPHEGFLYRWDCGRREYSAVVFPNIPPNSVVFANLVEGRGAERLKSFPVLPPPITDNRTASERQKGLERLLQVQLGHARIFAQMMVDSELEAIAQLANQFSRSSLAFQDPVLGQAFVELSGPGSEALTAQLRYIRTTLGTPTTSQCAIEDERIVCAWTLPDPQNQLIAGVRTGLGEQLIISSADFRYSTPEKLREVGADEDTVLTFPPKTLSQP